MKVLGIDFGTKRIGIAVSDEGGTMAFPHSVISQGPGAVLAIKELAEQEGAATLVLGEPGEGQAKSGALAFKTALEVAGLSVILEKEFMTSLHTDMFTKTKPIARKMRQERGEKRDESAAALILQRYLDRRAMRNNR